MTSSLRIPTHTILKYRKSLVQIISAKIKTKNQPDAYQFIITTPKKIHRHCLSLTTFFFQYLNLFFFLSVCLVGSVFVSATCWHVQIRLLERTQMNDKMKAKSPKKLHAHTHKFDKPFEMDQTNFKAWILLLALLFLSFFHRVSFDRSFARYFSSLGFKFPNYI